MNFSKNIKNITLTILTVFVGFSFAELVVDYQFDGDATDATGKGHNATYTNVTFVEDGFEGKAAQFGLGSNLSTPDADDLDLSTLTLEAWVMPTGSSRFMNIIGKWGPLADRSYILNLTFGRPTFIISPDGGHTGTTITMYADGAGLPLNVWSHIVATFDDDLDKMSIYIDGELRGEKVVGTEFRPYKGVAPLCVGIDGWNTSPMLGLIDNARIYNHALTFGNEPPVAVASFVQTSQIINLDGSGSSDPDGTIDAYEWTLTAPDGSLSELSDPTEISPIFNMDIFDDYTVQLIVTDNDGVQSEPSIITVSPLNAPPVVDAGPDQAVDYVGTSVQLDGSQSDDPDGDLVTYLWEITEPENSGALFDDPELPNPLFTADAYETYTITLTVTDAWGLSAIDEVIVSFENVKPVAYTDENQSCVINEAVILSGSGSDDNGDDLTYLWQIFSGPDESQATIKDETSTSASIVPDVPGEYVVSLTVNDGTENSAPSFVSIVAVSYNDALTLTLQDAIVAVKSIPKKQFRCKRMRKILTKLLNINMLLANRGRYKVAYMQLSYGIMRKLDGCERNGCPDRNDWIRNCDAQGQVYPILIEAKELLAEILEN